MAWRENMRANLHLDQKTFFVRTSFCSLKEGTYIPSISSVEDLCDLILKNPRVLRAFKFPYPHSIMVVLIPRIMKTECACVFLSICLSLYACTYKWLVYICFGESLEYKKKLYDIFASLVFLGERSLLVRPCCRV
jgi:hypothetical protein